MTQDPGPQPTDGANVPVARPHPADALEAMFNNASAGSPTLNAPITTVDGVVVAAGPSEPPPGELVLAAGGSVDTFSHVDAAAGPVAFDGFPPVANPFTVTGPPRRRKLAKLGHGWRYAIPPLAAMATAMFLLSGWAAAQLIGVLPVKDHNPGLLMVMLLAGVVLGGFMAISCVIIARETHVPEPVAEDMAAAPTYTETIVPPSAADAELHVGPTGEFSMGQQFDPAAPIDLGDHVAPPAPPVKPAPTPGSDQPK